jgi:hypothetical protein
VSGSGPLSGELREKYNKSTQNVDATISKLVAFFGDLTHEEQETALNSTEVIDLLGKLTLRHIADFYSILPASGELRHAISGVARNLLRQTPSDSEEDSKLIKKISSLLLEARVRSLQDFNSLRAIFPNETTRLAARFFDESRQVSIPDGLEVLPYLQREASRHTVLNQLIDNASSVQDLGTLTDFISEKPEFQNHREALINRAAQFGSKFEKGGGQDGRSSQPHHQTSEGSGGNQKTIDQIQGNIQRLLDEFRNVQNPATTSTRKIEKLLEGFGDKSDLDKRKTLEGIGAVLEEAKARDRRWFTQYFGIGKRSQEADALYDNIRAELAKIPPVVTPAASASKSDRMMGMNPRGDAPSRHREQGHGPHSPSAGA